MANERYYKMTARLTQLTQLLDKNPNDAFLLFAVAKEYEKMGDPVEALRFYQRLQATQPDYVGLYYHLGKLHERGMDIPQAIQAYQNGVLVAQKAGDRHALSELKGALMELGEE